MREVTKEVGVDALRFMMISRNADKTIDFDFDSLKIKIKIILFFMFNTPTQGACQS